MALSVYFKLWALRRFIGAADAHHIAYESGPGFLIQAFDIPLFADRKRCADVYLCKVLWADKLTRNHQAEELAKRIIDYKRNEQFLVDFNTDEADAELWAWMYCSPRFELIQLIKVHEKK